MHNLLTKCMYPQKSACCLHAGETSTILLLVLSQYFYWPQVTCSSMGFTAGMFKHANTFSKVFIFWIVDLLILLHFLYIIISILSWFFHNYMLNWEVSTSPHLNHEEKKLVRRVFLFSKAICIKIAYNNKKKKKMCSFIKAIARSLCISEETLINQELKENLNKQYLWMSLLWNFILRQLYCICNTN